jgi:hypothetical protein
MNYSLFKTKEVNICCVVFAFVVRGGNNRVHEMVVEAFVKQYPEFDSPDYVHEEDVHLGRWFDAPPLWKSLINANEGRVDLARLRAAFAAGLWREVLELRAGNHHAGLVGIHLGDSFQGDSLLGVIYSSVEEHWYSLHDGGGDAGDLLLETDSEWLRETVRLIEYLHSVRSQFEHLSVDCVYADFQMGLCFSCYSWSSVVSAVVQSGVCGLRANDQGNRSSYYHYSRRAPHFYEWLACESEAFESWVSCLDSLEAQQSHRSMYHSSRSVEEHSFLIYGGVWCLVSRQRTDALRIGIVPYLDAMHRLSSERQACGDIGHEKHLAHLRGTITAKSLLAVAESWNSRVLCARMLEHYRVLFLPFPIEVRRHLASFLIKS